MRKHSTAFYVETILLILAFAAIIPVLTSIFGGAKATSSQAQRLTKSVVLAQNAAEAVNASDSLEEVQSLLEKDGNTQLTGSVLAVFEDDYKTEITWEPDGEIVSGRITVYYNEEPVYSLETAVYVGRKEL